MNALCNQTVLPDEVVISLSEIDKLNPALIKKFENKKYPFPVKLIKHRELLWAGPNRNSACEHAIGDIFICQDADDLPHPQRIEIIKYFFENFDVNHLIHCFSYEPITEKYNTTSLNYTRLKSRGIIEACL